MLNIKTALTQLANRVKAEKDYVVEYKINDADKWSYRKWASGIAECWLFYYNTIAPYSSGGVDNFKYSYTAAFDLPFAFVTNSDKIIIADIQKQHLCL